jgi:hypothetical protein
MNNVLSRPLFRQAGGPILPSAAPMNTLPPPPAMPSQMPPAMPPQMPPAMPPQMPPAMPSQMPPAMGLMEDDLTAQAEMTAEAQMEQAGAEYMSGVFSGIDNAETSEDLINALRGQNLPIQARYEELAMIVGPEDASNTPDSVLALAQPGIMMATGGVDGGIGMLMEDLTVGAEMVTPEGAPTDMGQGVGNLMMGGAGPMPMDPGPMPMDPGPMPMGPEMGMAPQYLARGGSVIKKFQNGLGVNADGGVLEMPPTIKDAIKEITKDLPTSIGIEKQYEQLLPLYTDIVGSTGASRKAQAQLALGQAALDWGSGKYAGRGTSPFAQGAEAISSALPSLAALSAARDKEKQTAKLAALTSASDLESSARKGLLDLATAQMRLLPQGTESNKAVRFSSERVKNLMENFEKTRRDLFSKEELKRGVSEIANNLINLKSQRSVTNGQLLYRFTTDELRFIRTYDKTLKALGRGPSAFGPLIEEMDAEPPIKDQNGTPKVVQNPAEVRDLLKRRADGGGVKSFNNGGEAAVPLKDPGDPAMLMGGSNIIPAIANYAYGAVGQPLPNPEQRQARNYYREMIAKYNRQSGDIIGGYTGSDRMSAAREPGLAEEQKTTFPPEGSLWPSTWIGDEAALRDIVSKRNNVEQRINSLQSTLTKLGEPTAALSNTAISDTSLQLEQLRALRDEMDVFTKAMAKSMGGGGRDAARQKKRAAVELIKKMENERNP